MIESAVDVAVSSTAPVKLRLVDGAPTLDLGRFDLAPLGYEVREYFACGAAESFSAEQDIVRVQGATPFCTRMVVVSPIAPEQFSGTAVVEWLNVTGGHDFAADWAMAHREITRRGHVYVGISAQQTGIEGGNSLRLNDLPLKVVDPQRYGELLHPGDAFSFDIFSKVAAAFQAAAHEIVGKPAERMLAIGASQSASFLVTYVNLADPVAQIFDGFVIHGRNGRTPPIDGRWILSVSLEELHPTRFRPNLRAPVMVVLAESDVIGIRSADATAEGLSLPGYFFARQDEERNLRVWEIAGSSHANGYAFAVAPVDSGRLPTDELASAFRPTKSIAGTSVDRFVNPDPQQHYVLEAALWHLDQWITTGAVPPKAKPLTTRIDAHSDGWPSLVQDELGIATGGVRTPWVDVPIATVSGYGNSGGPLAFLAGSYEPFTQARLENLYPGGRQEYVSKFRTVLAGTIEAGFLLPAQEDEILEIAAALYPQ